MEPDDDEEYAAALSEDEESGSAAAAAAASKAAAASGKKRAPRAAKVSAAAAIVSKKGGGSGAKHTGSGPRARMHRPKPLAQILLEDSLLNRNARARGESGAEAAAAADYVSADARGPVRPAAKICAATGKQGRYCDPASGLWYADMAAARRLTERAPPWATLNGSAPYFDSMRTLHAYSDDNK